MSGMTNIDPGRALQEALKMPAKSRGVHGQTKYLSALLASQPVQGLGAEVVESLRKAAKKGDWEAVIKIISERVAELRDSLCGTSSLKVGESCSFNGGNIRFSLASGRGNSSKLLIQINHNGKSSEIECPHYNHFNGSKPNVGSIVVSPESGVAIYMLCGSGIRKGKNTVCMVDKDGKITKLSYQPPILQGSESPSTIDDVFFGRDNKGNPVPYGVVGGFAVKLTEK